MTKSNRLPVLAESANAAHRQAVASMRNAVEHAHAAGELLLEAKCSVPHGQWGRWLKENFEGTPRSAQRYMRLALRWSDITAKTTSMSDLTVSSALDLLDDRSDLERALALEAEQQRLHQEVRRLADQIGSASATELRWMIDRLSEIEARGQDIRLRATREVGRLMRDLGIDAEGAQP